MNFSPLFLASSITSFLFLTFVSRHAGIFSNFSHSFCTAAFASGVFNAWGHGNKFAHWVLVTELIYSFRCSMILMIPVRSSFQSNSRGTRQLRQYKHVLFCCSQYRSRFLAVYGVLQGIAAGIGTSNFLRAFFHDVLELLILRINEEDTTQFSGIFELSFLDSPLLLYFAFRCVRHMIPHIWPYIVGSWGHLFPRQSPRTVVYPSGGLSFNKINLVKLVHASDNSRSSSTFQ